MKKFLKWFCYIFLILFFVFVLLRIFLFQSANVFSVITPTANAKAAAAAGEDILTHKMINEISDNGYMRAYSFIYIPSKGEIQVTVKYNLSVYAKEGFSEDTPLAFKLYETKEEKEFFASESSFEKKGNYGYYKLIFENVDFDAEYDLEIVMSTYDFEKDLSVYKLHMAGIKSQKFVPYKLSKKERNLLGI